MESFNQNFYGPIHQDKGWALPCLGKRNVTDLLEDKDLGEEGVERNNNYLTMKRNMMWLKIKIYN